MEGILTILTVKIGGFKHETLGDFEHETLEF
jgi:hypothetical protein